MQIKDLSFQQELNLDEANIKGGLFNPFSINTLGQFQGTFQTVGAASGGGIGSNTLNSPSLALGFQIPGQAGAVI